MAYILSREFFHMLEDAINEARYEIDETYHMQRDQLAAELGDVPGVDTLSVRFGDGLQFVTYNGRTTALSEAASIDDIRRALNLAKIDNLITAPASAMEALMTANPIERLKEKLAKAAGVGGRVAAKIEAKADALIAREGQLESKVDHAFAPHEAIADAANTQLDMIESAVDLLSNGGPPLDG
jgi:hypothetical protein